MIVHKCPDGDSSIMPCCYLLVFEAPRSDRITLIPELVDCPGAGLFDNFAVSEERDE